MLCYAMLCCKASLAALRLYGFLWYCYDDVLSENKYDDDDDTYRSHTGIHDRLLQLHIVRVQFTGWLGRLWWHEASVVCRLSVERYFDCRPHSTSQSRPAAERHHHNTQLRPNKYTTLSTLSTSSVLFILVNPLTPTAAIRVQLLSILCQTGLSCHLWFLTSGHSDAHDWASECPGVKSYKWQLNPVWHRMLYSCTHMATVGVNGLTGKYFHIDVRSCHVHQQKIITVVNAAIVANSLHFSTIITWEQRSALV